MKYQVGIEIDLPLERVVELFDDADNLSEWQPGLRGLELIEGTAGAPGAKTRMTYEERGRTFDMIETIVVRDLPREFSARYEMGRVANTSSHRFEADGPERTRWTSSEVFEFSGVARLMPLVMKGAFVKQSRANMLQFKAFAEGIGEATEEAG